jgi:predicted TIM-barrel fold metal-dependent hydrolase
MRNHHTLVLTLCLFFTGVAHAAGPVFDMHVHLRDGEASLQKFKAETRESGVELSGIGAMWFGGPHQALAGNPAHIRAKNDALIAMAARHPDVVPIATVHPYDGQAALDELTGIAERGVRTLKIHPHTQQFAISDPRVLTLLQKAGDLGMTVLMDNAGIVPGDTEDLFNLAFKAPKARFIFAHMGGMQFRFWNILVLVRTADGFGLDNVFFDISGTVLLAADSPIEDEFVWTLRNVGIHRVMIGSDYPQIGLAPMVEALEKLDLTREEKAGILSGNARRVLVETGRREP